MLTLQGLLARAVALIEAEGWEPGYSDQLQAAVLDQLRQILADDDLTSEVVAGSSRHANGFSKVVLGQLPATGAVLRLHAWPTTTSNDESDPHGHRWPFHSIVLTGALRVDEYIAALPPDGRDSADALIAERITYGSTRDHGWETFSSTAEHSRLRPVGTRVLHAGDTTTVGTQMIHRVVNVEAPAVTLVVTGIATQEYSIVYRLGSRRAIRHSSRSLHRLTAWETRQALELAIAASSPTLPPPLNPLSSPPDNAD